MDKRNALQKALWEKVGPPLYYSSECMLAVSVTPIEGQEPTIERPCGDCNCQIIAPRKAIMPGEGGLNMGDRVKQGYAQMAAALTGRCV
jgi:hypothetical protein